MDKKKKEKFYDLNGELINLYNIVELKKDYDEEAFPSYGYYGVMVLTLDDGELVKSIRYRIGNKESSLDDAYRNVSNKIDEIKRLLERL